MVLPTNAVENADFKKFVYDLGLYTVLIGVYKDATGKWVDNDGEYVTWFNWDQLGEQWDGAVMLQEWDGTWNETPMSNRQWSWVVCQKPVQVQPATTTVDSCNDDDGVIQLTATLRNISGAYGQNAEGEITFTRDELTPSFDTDNNLVMSVDLGGDGCTQAQVDGVSVCTGVGETITLQCKYSLADVQIEDSFEVTGQDTATTAEGTGSLGYTLSVEDNKAIGESVQFTITPVNEGLVYATVKHCEVTNGAADNDDELTIIGHGVEGCTNPVVNAAADTTRFTSQEEIQGTWTAFKWSTAAADNVEAQGLRCTIGLSQLASQVDVEDCELTNAPSAP